MSSETNKHKDQAEHLKQLFDEVQQNEKVENTVSDASTVESTEIQQLKIDVLNLPPRKEVHSDQDSRMRLKVGRPFLRFTSVVIILAIIIICIFVFGREEFMQIIKNL